MTSNSYNTEIPMLARLLSAIIVLFLAGWAIGFFMMGMGTVVHLLLVMAVIAAIMRVITDKD
jgi:hypothetical protein